MIESKALNKYLHTRAASGPWSISGSQASSFRLAVVIPALAESQSLPQTLAALANNPAELLAQTLVLIVVNQRSDASESDKLDNQRTLAWLAQQPFAPLKLGWIDAASPATELPPSEGVGLARKIGFDRVLERLDWSRDPLLISLDADTLVAGDYLPAIEQHFKQSTAGAAVLPFRHQAGENAAQEQAIRAYEDYLHRYRAGLQRAGSPYAWHSIGSAIALRGSAYLAAGGMNRRLAAEDFYFLQQLTKVAGVELLSGTTVHPSARFSGRVPFGTGRTVQAQVEQGALLYQPLDVRCFVLLQRWLELVTERVDAAAEEILRQAESLSPVLALFLNELDFSRVWGRLQQNHKTSGQRLRAFHHWFDALRTRQLLTRVQSSASNLSS